MWRQVLGRSKLQGRRQHLLGAAAQRFIRQACWITNKYAARVVCIGLGNVVNPRAAAAFFELGHVYPDIIQITGLFRVGAWPLNRKPGHFTVFQRVAKNCRRVLGCVGVESAHRQAGSLATWHGEVIDFAPNGVTRFFNRDA